MEQQIKNILVIGGAGFIGSNLCEELVKRGHNVLCIDNFCTGSQKNIDHLLQSANFEFIKHDLIDPINLDEQREAQKFKFEFYGIQEIYHLACPVSSKERKKIAFNTIFAHSHVTRNVFEIAEKYKSKVFYASSAAVYGPVIDSNYLVNETYVGKVDNLGESSIYDEGKRFGETICSFYKKYKNVDVKIGRVFTTFGPKMKVDNGFFMSEVVYNALNNLDINIDYHSEDVGSFCYVKDLVEAMIILMENGEFGPYNIGNPEVVRIYDVVNSIKKITNSTSNISFNNDSLKKRVVPDISKIKEVFGWFPLTLLEDALKDTIDYIKAVKNTFNSAQFFEDDEDDDKLIENKKDDSNNIFKMIFKG